MESAIIISESKRPYWQLVIAALLLTFAFYVLLISCLDISWSFKDVLPMAHSLEFVVFIRIFTHYYSLGYHPRRNIC